MLAGAKSSLFRMGKEEKCGKRESELAAGLLIARGALVGARVGAEGGGGALVVVVVVVVEVVDVVVDVVVINTDSIERSIGLELDSLLAP